MTVQEAAPTVGIASQAPESQVTTPRLYSVPTAFRKENRTRRCPDQPDATPGAESLTPNIRAALGEWPLASSKQPARPRAAPTRTLHPDRALTHVLPQLLSPVMTPDCPDLPSGCDDVLTASSLPRRRSISYSVTRFRRLSVRVCC